MNGPPSRDAEHPSGSLPQDADQGDIRRGGWILVLVGVVLLLVAVVLVILLL